MKIKKIVMSLLALGLLLSILLCTACEKKPEASDDSDTNKDTPTTQASIFTVSYKGTTIELGKDASAVRKALGDPTSEPKRVASCGDGAGEQWQYTYSSIVLFTVKNGESETVDAIVLRDDIAKTGKGITVGSTEAEMTEAYGEPNANGQKRTYTKGSYTLEFQVNDTGVITHVELRVES